MANTDEQLDAKLMGLLKQGSLSAFNAIYAMYAKKLKQYVSGATKNKEDAEEIVHDIFLSLWNNRAKLDTSQSLSSLLFSLAYRRRIDFFRHLLSLPIYEDYQQWQNELITEDHYSMEYKEFCDIFNRALNRLNERQRKVVVLSRLHGMSGREIARKLDISEKNGA